MKKHFIIPLVVLINIFLVFNAFAGLPGLNLSATTTQTGGRSSSHSGHAYWQTGIGLAEHAVIDLTVIPYYYISSWQASGSASDSDMDNVSVSTSRNWVDGVTMAKTKAEATATEFIPQDPVHYKEKWSSEVTF